MSFVSSLLFIFSPLLPLGWIPFLERAPSKVGSRNKASAFSYCEGGRRPVPIITGMTALPAKHFRYFCPSLPSTWFLYSVHCAGLLDVQNILSVDTGISWQTEGNSFGDHLISESVSVMPSCVVEASTLLCSVYDSCESMSISLRSEHPILHYSLIIVPTVAARSTPWNVFAHSKTKIVDSNPTRGMDVCLCLFCIVLSCVGSGLVMSRSLSKESFRLYIRLGNWSETKRFIDSLSSRGSNRN
jgi:hypothetical protein